LGSKLEHNAYSGFEYEPSAQLVWNISAHNALWASVARAVRQAARRDYGIDVDLAAVPAGNNNYGVIELHGNPNTQSENMRDLEVGYRSQLSNRLSVDVTGFVSLYRRLAGTMPGAPFFATQNGTSYLEFPQVWGYGGRANNYGAEIFTHWNVSHRWQLSTGFSWLNMHLTDPDQGGETVLDPSYTPTHTIQLRSSVNLTRQLEWDSSLSNMSKINGIPGYTRVDTRLGWHIGESVDVSLVGQNLLTSRHLEFPSQYFITSTPVHRSVSVRLSVRVLTLHAHRHETPAFSGGSLLPRSAGRQCGGPGSHRRVPRESGFSLQFRQICRWPAGAFKGPEDPVAICVLGRNPFGNLLDELVGKNTAAGAVSSSAS
jgi:iron complex outermembrane receptor protein